MSCPWLYPLIEGRLGPRYGPIVRAGLLRLARGCIHLLRAVLGRGMGL